MKWTRREWMERTALAGAAVAVPTLEGCDDDVLPDPDPCNAGANDTLPSLPTYSNTGPEGPADLFSHGIASGDPLIDRVILWTRLSPTAPASIDVWWEVALDSAFTRRVAQGTFATSDARDYTVKVDATGLLPGRAYYYRFFALGIASPIGRTRTAPSGAVSRLRFGVVSCSSFAHGYFHSYRRLSERNDLDAILHLGDYIYEYKNAGFGGLRPYDPATEILTLDDYRRRHRHYKGDPDLRAVHAQHPFITIWDDHEVANDAWKDGAENHDPATEGSYVARKAAAVQAYMEWMPIREQGGSKIHRSFHFGDLVDLVCVDTRHWGRDLQVVSVSEDSASRTLLGTDQEAWVASELSASTARFRLIANQVVLAPTLFGGSPFNMDSWDGYPAARGRLLDAIDASIGNVVVLTGDIHSSWVQEVPRNPLDTATYDPKSSAGSLAVEFVVPSVTSAGLVDENGAVAELLLQDNPHLRYVDLNTRGYCVIDVRPSKVQCDYVYVADVTTDTGGAQHAGPSFAVYAGSNRIVKMSGPEHDATTCEAAPT